MIKNPDLKDWFEEDTKHRKKDLLKVFDVEYVHLTLSNNDDLYVTQFGIHCLENLKPHNHCNDKDWFHKNSEKLSGTSSVYRVRTRNVNGIYKDIVLKWNRMGQDIPGGYETEELLYASFNSPFEEFSLVMELREEIENKKQRINIQKPLAIYVPADRVELSRIGRKEYYMDALIEKHDEVELDMHRKYAVIYEWITGLDLGQAFRLNKLKQEHIKSMSIDAHEKLMSIGYLVKDGKPNHVIIEPEKGNEIAQYMNGDHEYGMVDFELLARSQERAVTVKKKKRLEYLRRQKERFSIDLSDKYHPHLKHTNIMGVDYIYGKVESTKGQLWVVGKDPYLFDYFLPERWEEEKKTKVSTRHGIYYTVTKDDIHLVWRRSKVGFLPDMDPNIEKEKMILDHGYNSPFEEFFIAVELDRLGIPTIYPRAIYMTARQVNIPRVLYDANRYNSHIHFITPDGKPVLMKNREYIKIWGYWNGPDDMLASKDGDYYKGMNALHAFRKNVIEKKEYISIMERAKERLSDIGIEDLFLRGTHLLISIDSKGNNVLDKDGHLEFRICNFSFLKVK